MGYGDIPVSTIAERIIAIIAMFSGVIFFSLTVGSLTSILSEQDRKNNLYEEKMRIMSQIASDYHVKNENLFRKLTISIKYQIYRTDDNANTLLQVIPKRQALELSDIIYRDLFKGLKLFENASAELRMAVAPFLTYHKFVKQEIIYSAGDYASEIYFIKKGCCALIVPEYNNEICLTVNEGLYFGEIEIIYNSSRKFTFQALTELEVVSLDKSRFAKIFFKEFKEYGRRIKEYADKRRLKQVRVYDKFLDILHRYYDKNVQMICSKNEKAKEELTSQLFPMIYQGTLVDNGELELQQTFIDRNKTKLDYGVKKESVDILLDKVTNIVSQG